MKIQTMEGVSSHLLHAKSTILPGKEQVFPLSRSAQARAKRNECGKSVAPISTSYSCTSCVCLNAPLFAFLTLLAVLLCPLADPLLDLKPAASLF
jgi:hypothetical protein